MASAASSRCPRSRAALKAAPVGATARMAFWKRRGIGACGSPSSAYAQTARGLLILAQDQLQFSRFRYLPATAGPRHQLEPGSGEIPLGLSQDPAPGILEQDVPHPLFDLLDDVGLIAELPSPADRHRIGVPARPHQSIQGFGRLRTRLVGPQHRQGQVCRVQTAVRLHGDALEQQRRGNAHVDPPRLPAVEVPGMTLKISTHRRLERILVQPLQKIRLNPVARPVHIAATDQLQVLSCVPDRAQDPREKPQSPPALVERLQRP